MLYLNYEGHSRNVLCTLKSLLQRFSSPEPDDQSSRKQGGLRRQEACAISSASSDDSHRSTPERSQSLRIKRTNLCKRDEKLFLRVIFGGALHASSPFLSASFSWENLEIAEET
jgi:hypothetical protein